VEINRWVSLVDQAVRRKKHIKLLLIPHRIDLVTSIAGLWVELIGGVLVLGIKQLELTKNEPSCGTNFGVQKVISIQQQVEAVEEADSKVIPIASGVL
jgi:hypothetical protein